MFLLVCYRRQNGRRLLSLVTIKTGLTKLITAQNCLSRQCFPRLETSNSLHLQDRNGDVGVEPVFTRNQSFKQQCPFKIEVIESCDSCVCRLFIYNKALGRTRNLDSGAHSPSPLCPVQVRACICVCDLSTLLYDIILTELKLKRLNLRGP